VRFGLRVFVDLVALEVVGNGNLRAGRHCGGEKGKHSADGNGRAKHGLLPPWWQGAQAPDERWGLMASPEPKSTDIP
jgi:hypothetical protein